MSKAVIRYCQRIYYMLMENDADVPVKVQVVHFDIGEVVLTRIGPPSLLEAETVAPNHCNVLLST